MKKVKFTKKICILGFGSIGQATLPLIFKHIDVSPNQISIISTNVARIPYLDDIGVSYRIETITVENYIPILESVLTKGDLLINLTSDVDSIDLMKFAATHGVLYLDTCVETWPREKSEKMLQTTYQTRQPLLELKKLGYSSTALSSHGANPGVVSHLVKQGMLNIAQSAGINAITPHSKTEWSRLARELDIKVIHINERDTQITESDHGEKCFVSTWSVEAMLAEAMQPAEMALGTHEKEMPNGSISSAKDIPNCIYFNKSGKDTHVKTWLPHTGEQSGFLINHSEPQSIAEWLSHTEEGSAYAPTVCFVYRPCDATVESLKRMDFNNCVDAKGKVILREIIEGYDELGVLLFSQKYGAFWIGSKLDIRDARDLNLFSSATSLQVASGVVAGACWVIENPQSGIVEPEEIDHEFILRIVEPYWGGFRFVKADWKPNNDDQENHNSLQFKNFLLEQ